MDETIADHLDAIKQTHQHQSIEGLDASDLKDTAHLQRLLDPPQQDDQDYDGSVIEHVRTDISAYRDEQIDWLGPILGDLIDEGIADRPYGVAIEDARPAALLSIGPNGLALYEDVAESDLEEMTDTEDQRSTCGWMYNYEKTGDEFLTYVNLDKDSVTLNDSYIVGKHALMESSDLSMSDVWAEGRDTLKRSEVLSLDDCYIEARNALNTSEDLEVNASVVLGATPFQHYGDVTVRDSFVMGERPFMCQSTDNGDIEIYNSVIVGDSVFEGITKEKDLYLQNSIIAADEIESGYVVMNDSYHVTADEIHRYDTSSRLGKSSCDPETVQSI